MLCPIFVKNNQKFFHNFYCDIFQKHLTFEARIAIIYTYNKTLFLNKSAKQPAAYRNNTKTKVNAMRYSIQREMILNTVLEDHTHPSAESVYNHLKGENNDLSLGTVYRNLNILAKNHMLKKISIPNGSDRFDGTLSEHQHLVCTKCGKVTDVYISELEKIHNNVLDRSGFDINFASLAFEGICNECRSK